jgi:hypothetical protein
MLATRITKKKRQRLLRKGLPSLAGGGEGVGAKEVSSRQRQEKNTTAASHAVVATIWFPVQLFHLRPNPYRCTVH